ncbi:MAG: hypothetical protein H6684_11640 [Deltaproteobacteria bacterium]|nr:hypothetical protein [bacterium]MCB9478870.1 hypothetical protein [Deltaproteobacteria bacterium]MCB9489376.1 hypothetical protein [Deltaproteobacteria bacterium]
MLKLVLRYLIAIVMIPVGVVCGVGGIIQNHGRREYYKNRRDAMTQALATGEDAGPCKTE